MGLMLLGAGPSSPVSVAIPPQPSTLVLTDTFAGEAADANLTVHTADTGQTWSKHANFPDNLLIGSDTQVYGSGASNFAKYVTSLNPSSADYAIEVDISCKTVVGFLQLGLRQPAADSSGYAIQADGTNLQIVRFNAAGAGTIIASAAGAMTAASSHTVTGWIVGSTVVARLDGGTPLGVVDTTISATNKPTIRCRNSSLTTGFTIDTLRVYNS